MGPDMTTTPQAARRILREARMSDADVTRVLALLPVQRFDDRPYYPMTAVYRRAKAA